MYTYIHIFHLVPYLTGAVTAVMNIIRGGARNGGSARLRSLHVVCLYKEGGGEGGGGREGGGGDKLKAPTI